MVTVDLDERVNHIPGTKALGAGIDGLEAGEIDKVWTPHHIDLMKSAGFGPLSFRLRTELGIKAWHWHSEGAWSDPAKKQGYWVSAPTSGHDPGVSYGYDLPRRGSTIDQANNSGYSRLTDGDETSFWKSNPYLDPHFTKEGETEHPQWIMLDMAGRPSTVDALRINWGAPYARKIKVQYWVGKGGAVHPVAKDGRWEDFPTSEFTAKGGEETFRLGTARRVDYVRVQLFDSSQTGPASDDIRDRLGFAIREVSLGRGSGGSFTDVLKHSPDQKQTVTYASSTDPWHRASDIDKDYEHASFERVYASGLTNDQPLMVPVAVLYGVPEDAAALLRHLRDKGHPVERIEMGEEPDGQLAQPEHYGVLYLQVADALKSVDADIEMGGPGYQTTLPNWIHWPDKNGNKSWTGRFVAHLRDRNRMDDFDFFSFEWYPFDDVCANTTKPMAQNPGMLHDLMQKQVDAGLPADIPKVITELGYSSFAGQPEVELSGAIVNAESTAKFLQIGGETVYFYGLEPNWVFQEKEGEPCNTWGNLMLFQFYDDWQTRPVATYYGSQLLTKEWLLGDENHEVFNATVTGAKGAPLVTAYPVNKPDGRLSVLLFNKDPKRETTVRLETISDGERNVVPGKLAVTQYSPEQYDWDPTHGSDSRGRPIRNHPPEEWDLEHEHGAVVTLPPSSITVVQKEGRNQRGW